MRQGLGSAIDALSLSPLVERCVQLTRSCDRSWPRRIRFDVGQELSKLASHRSVRILVDESHTGPLAPRSGLVSEPKRLSDLAKRSRVSGNRNPPSIIHSRLTHLL
jgi:hypothetical protein